MNWHNNYYFLYNVHVYPALSCCHQFLDNMAIRLFIVRLITRPVLVPIGVGSFGLWYGGFDVAYLVSRKIVTTFDSSLSTETTKSNRAISSLSGVSVGSLFLYGNYSGSPFKGIELPELQLKSFFRDLPTYVKSNIAILKSLNVSRGVVLFVTSGFLSGFSKSVVETYLSHHVWCVEHSKPRVLWSLHEISAFQLWTLTIRIFKWNDMFTCYWQLIYN